LAPAATGAALSTATLAATLAAAALVPAATGAALAAATLLAAASTTLVATALAAAGARIGNRQPRDLPGHRPMRAGGNVVVACENGDRDQARGYAHEQWREEASYSAAAPCWRSHSCWRGSRVMARFRAVLMNSLVRSGRPTRLTGSGALLVIHPES
jgi:hypothetical protein